MSPKVDENGASTSVATEGSSSQLTPCVNQTEEKCLTLSGTIRRGNKSGQNVDVKVNVSRMELERLENKTKSLGIESSTGSSSYCSLSKGLHVFLWTVLCFPLVFVISSVYSFGMGTSTWYNILTIFTDEKPVLYRIFAAPILVLLYPFIIVMVSLGVGIYSSFDQITYEWASWLVRVQDLEKGFYLWLCQMIHLEECSPYTEVIIVHQLPATISTV